jgi:hypothetical protein
MWNLELGLGRQVCRGGSCSSSRTPCGYVDVKNPRKRYHYYYQAYSYIHKGQIPLPFNTTCLIGLGYSCLKVQITLICLYYSNVLFVLLIVD